MPSFKFSLSLRSLMAKTAQSRQARDEKVSSTLFVPDNLVAPIAPVHRPAELVMESAMEDAFHDPTVLDIQRSMKFGLSNCIFEVNKVAIPLASPIISSLLPSSPVNLSVVSTSSDPGTPSLTSNSSSSASSSTSFPASPNLDGVRELSLADIKIVKLLSQGSSGQVFFVIDKLTRERRALKVIPHGGKPAHEILRILEEQTIMRSLNDLNSPYHLKLDASFCDTKSFYFVMPLYPTDIESELVRCRKFDVERARFYFVEAYIALTKLHKDGIVHRDVKPGNMLIGTDGHVVLADFGLAHDFNDFPTLAERIFPPYWPFARGDIITGPETPYRRPEELPFVLDSMCGTLFHMSPELVSGKHYSFPADIWALGVTLYIMVTGRPPFDAESDTFEDMKHEILHKEVEFLPEDGVDEITQDFICSLLQKMPNDRLRLTELEEHPFFAGIKWPLFEQRLVPPPWVPGPQPTHIFHSKARDFVPGVPFDGPNPYPIFEYTSDAIAAGVIRTADVVNVADLPEDFYDTKDELVPNPQASRPASSISRFKTLLKTLLTPRSWFWRQPPEPVPSQTCPDANGATPPALPSCNPPSRSSDSTPWATIHITASSTEPPSPDISTTTPLSSAPLKERLWNKVREWFRNLRIPRASHLPETSRRLDLLS